MSLFYLLMTMYFCGYMQGYTTSGALDSWRDELVISLIIFVISLAWPLVIMRKIYRAIRNKK